MSSSDPLTGGQQRWRLDIAYDGAAFSGFAYQPESTTVVGVLRETLASTLHLEAEPLIVGAGRTDAGVHAFGQVVHVDLPTTLFTTHRGPDPERLADSLNKQLRGRIQIRSARPVRGDFHARFSATWREYRYLVLETTPPALGSSNAWSWAVEGPLDVALMNEVSRDVLGTHDFTTFAAADPDLATRANAEPAPAPIRTITRSQWLSHDGLVIYRVTANGFLHHMVRNLVGTFVQAGARRLSPDSIPDLLAARNRAAAGPTAPPQGLFLVNVEYPNREPGASNLEPNE